jgi:DNA adenine methylase
MTKIPHPIPYQGSKRKLAPKIAEFLPEKMRTFYEPFAGSIAMTLFVANHGGAEKFVIGDSLGSLIDLWELIIDKPGVAVSEYSKLWGGQEEGDFDYFNRVRSSYNESHDPIILLYLICRCVKNAVRFNASGRFTQSADKRRKGMSPERMGTAIFGASKLLKGKIEFRKGDWRSTTEDAGSQDFVYMDPPYLGTSVGRDKRYHQQLLQEPLIEGLADLNERSIRFALSYDGMTGDKEYGPPLPDHLEMKRILISAGRSAQATLQGINAETVESLYLSSNIKNIERQEKALGVFKVKKQSLAI